MFTIISHSQGSISFRLAAELSGKMTAEIMSSIYAQVNPEALGQDFMDLNVAKKYLERLNKRSGNLKHGAIDRLVYEYPTHDFVIDFDEAKELFEHVELPTSTLVKLMEAKMAAMLRPRLRQQGVVEMLTIPGKPEERQGSRSEEEEKGNDSTKTGGGGDD